MAGDSSLQSIGRTLRAAREQLGLSVEQAERDTRIRAKFLVALENGDLGVIPVPVQARGFLFNYAQYLRLNPIEVIQSYDAIMGGQAPDASPAPASPYAPPVYATPTTPTYQPPKTHIPSTPTASPEVPPPGVPRTLLRPDSTPEPVPAPFGPLPESDQPSVPEESFVRRLLSSDVFVLAVLALLTVVILGVGSRFVQNSSGEAGTGAENGPGALEGLTGDGTPGTPTATFAPTSTPTATPPLLAADRVRITIEVVQRDWLTVNVDSEEVFEGLAEAGTILQYEGLEQVRIQTGNAGALKVTHNGIEQGALGPLGQVAERIYTLAGMETLTPTPTPSPTITPLPTVTQSGPTSTPGETPEPTETLPPDSP